MYCSCKTLQDFLGLLVLKDGLDLQDFLVDLEVPVQVGLLEQLVTLDLPVCLHFSAPHFDKLMN